MLNIHIPYIKIRFIYIKQGVKLAKGSFPYQTHTKKNVFSNNVHILCIYIYMICEPLVLQPIYNSKKYIYFLILYFASIKCDFSSNILLYFQKSLETLDKNALKKQLEEMQKQAEAFKQQLKEKQEEAETYKKRLSDIGLQPEDQSEELIDQSANE